MARGFRESGQSPYQVATRNVKHTDGAYGTGAAAWDPTTGRLGGEVHELPKELRKKAFSGLDRTFLSILFLTLVLEVGLVIYLLGHVRAPERRFAPASIPRGYVDLIVRRRPTQAMPAEPLPTAGEEALPTLRSPLQPVPGFERETAETAGPAAESVARGVTAAAEERADTREARASRVRSVGVLRLITGGGSGAVDVQSMAPTLEATEGTVRELGTVLAQVDGLTVPHGEQPGIRGGRVLTSTAQLKGQRAARPVDDISQLVGEVAPLAAARERAVEKTRTLERLPSTVPTRPPAEQLRGLTRSAEDVSRVIRSHHSAIQDCYKAALRTRPDTRGEITVRLWVSPDGEVVDAQIVSSTVDNPELERCVVRKVLAWSDFGFADPELGVAVYRQTYQFGQ